MLFGFWALFLFMMLLIYLKQESMLYVPKLPFQLPEENSTNYNSPSDRGIKYEEISV